MASPNAKQHHKWYLYDHCLQCKHSNLLYIVSVMANSIWIFGCTQNWRWRYNTQLCESIVPLSSNELTVTLVVIIHANSVTVILFTTPWQWMHCDWLTHGLCCVMYHSAIPKLNVRNTNISTEQVRVQLSLITCGSRINNKARSPPSCLCWGNPSRKTVQRDNVHVNMGRVLATWEKQK